MAQVLIVMGSDSDLEIMKPAADMLTKFGVSFQVNISSAHRTPNETISLAETAEAKGVKVIIAGAGGAAHLPGVIAACTILPVIGVPVKTSTLSGVDSLYSIVQMPAGIPVATVAINGSANAALLAIEIMALADADLKGKLINYRQEMAKQVNTKDAQLQELGVDGYLKTK
ncbi:MAG: 5-(carboxyamino)imidazole ribonucleotide mutase [Methylocystaceae bacterium]